MSKDTLRIKGILEGKTYAVIHSGDTKRRIDLNIAPPEVSVSQKEVRLFPARRKQIRECERRRRVGGSRSGGSGIMSSMRNGTRRPTFSSLKPSTRVKRRCALFLPRAKPKQCAFRCAAKAKRNVRASTARLRAASLSK